MRKTLLFIAFLVCALQMQAQTLPANMNLVPNGSFEYTGNLYNTDTTLENSVYCWIGATRLDLLFQYWPTSNICTYGLGSARTGTHWVELDDGGQVWDKTQQKWFDTTTVFKPRYAETKLLKSLVAGTTYYLTFYLGNNKSDSCDNCNVNTGILKNIGVRFDTSEVYDNTVAKKPLGKDAQIKFLNWVPAQTKGYAYTKFQASYTAQGGERYMTIGTFSWPSEYKIESLNPCYNSGGTTVGSTRVSRSLDDVSLVEDTTLPIIDLAHFSLGNDTTLCPGNSLTIGGEPNFFHYWWSTGDTTRLITVNQPGTYWCTIDYGCNNVTDTIHIYPPVSLSQKAFPDTGFCFPGNLTFKLPQSYPSQQWSTGTTGDSITVTTPGIYWVQRNNGCSIKRDSFTVTNKNTSIPLFSLPDKYLCNGGDTLLGPAGPFTYLWSTGDTTVSISVSQAGNYWLQVKNACNVKSADTAQLFLPANLALKPFRDTALCFPGTFSIQLPRRYKTQVWSTGDTGISIAVTAPGLYWVERNNGCTSKRDSFTVTNKNIPVPPLALPDIYLCDTVATAFAPAGPFTYLWSTGETTISTSFSQPGNYWLQITNACNLKRADTFTAQTAPTRINLGPDTLLCNTPPELLLSLPAGLTNILWSTGQTGSSILVQAAGTYSVEAQSPCGLLRDTIKIEVCPPEVEVLSLTPDTVCAGQCVEIGVAVKNTATSWEWTFAGGQPDRYSGPTPPRICYAVPGIYPLRLIVSNRTNSDTAITNVVVVEQPAPRFADTLLVARYGDMLRLPACASALHIDWYDEKGKLLCAGCPALPLEAKAFGQRVTCVVRNTDPCQDSCRYTIRVIDIPTDVWVPSGFTPNGDNLNEKLGVKTNNPNVRIDAFRIFDRWGEMMWDGKGLVDEGWDGTYRGTPVTIGTYYWMLQYHVEGAEGDFFLKGDVTLLR